MKKYGFALVVWAFMAGSCQQNDQEPTPAPCNLPAVTTTAPQAEVTALKQFIDSSGISATPDARGFYYSIQAPGSGSKPTLCSNVTVNYSGTLTNGTAFESANGVSFDLAGLIAGWQEGIPLIAPGGSITLYLPPSLAYGSRAQGSIPANSILIFKIDLIRAN